VILQYLKHNYHIFVLHCLSKGGFILRRTTIGVRRAINIWTPISRWWFILHDTAASVIGVRSRVWSACDIQEFNQFELWASDRGVLPMNEEFCGHGMFMHIFKGAKFKRQKHIIASPFRPTVSRFDADKIVRRGRRRSPAMVVRLSMNPP
jgi:hypothetical protein